MITQTQESSSEAWRAEVRDAIKEPGELLHQLGIDKRYLAGALRASKLFPLRAPRAYVKRIRHGDPHDPLLLQLLPQLRECHKDIFSSIDPLQEKQVLPVSGLMHKYRDRVLLLSTSVCAGHCRYCFRRHFPYQEQQLRAHMADALRYIEARTEIKEVILSGGDPLSESDTRLARTVGNLQNIKHLKRLRIHTRMPIFVPSRVTDALINLLRASRLKPIVVIHCNHANEIDSAVSSALRQLGSVCTLLNQSVLLCGVNDRASTLVALSEKLFECGVLPYYLHMMDAVRGAGAFHVSEKRARSLLGEAATHLPGYLTPKLVRESPNKGAKEVLPYDLPA